MVQNLPEELIFEIFLFVDVETLRILSETCSSFCETLVTNHFCNKYAQRFCSNFDPTKKKFGLSHILNSNSVSLAVELGFDLILPHLLNQLCSELENSQLDALFSCAIKNSQFECFKVLIDHFGEVDRTFTQKVVQTLLRYDELEMFKILFHSISIEFSPQQLAIDSIKYYTDVKIFSWLFDNVFVKFFPTVNQFVNIAIRKDNDKVLGFLFQKGYQIKEYFYDYLPYAFVNNCPRVFKFAIQLSDFDFNFDWLKEDNKNLYHVLFHLYPFLIPDLLPIIQKKSKLSINLTDNNGKRPIEYFLQRLVQNNELERVIQLLTDDENLDFAHTTIPSSENILPYLKALKEKGWFPSLQNLNDSLKNNSFELTKELFEMLINTFFANHILVPPLPLRLDQNDPFNKQIITILSKFADRLHWNQNLIENVLTWLRWGSSLPYIELTKKFIEMGKQKLLENEMFRNSCIVTMIRVNYDSIHSVIDKQFISPSMILPIVELLVKEIRPRALLSFCKLADIQLRDLLNNDNRKTRLSFFLDALNLKWTKGQRKRCQTNDNNFQKLWSEFNNLLKTSDTKAMALFIKEHPEIFNKQRLSVVDFRLYRQLCDDMFELDAQSHQ